DGRPFAILPRRVQRGRLANGAATGPKRRPMPLIFRTARHGWAFCDLMAATGDASTARTPPPPLGRSGDDSRARQTPAGGPGHGKLEPHAAAVSCGFASRCDAIDGQTAARAPDRRAPA